MKQESKMTRRRSDLIFILPFTPRKCEHVEIFWLCAIAKFFLPKRLHCLAMLFFFKIYKIISGRKPFPLFTKFVCFRRFLLSADEHLVASEAFFYQQTNICLLPKLSSISRRTFVCFHKSDYDSFYMVNNLPMFIRSQLRQFQRLSKAKSEVMSEEEKKKRKKSIKKASEICQFDLSHLHCDVETIPFRRKLSLIRRKLLLFRRKLLLFRRKLSLFCRKLS